MPATKRLAVATRSLERADRKDSSVGSADKVDAEQVAHQGFAALMAGKEKVFADSLKACAMAAAGQTLRTAPRRRRPTRRPNPALPTPEPR